MAGGAGARALRSGGRMAAWRAHAYGGRAELRLEAARVPPLRAPDDLLVRVRATSLNPLDVAMLDGYGARLLNILRSLEGGEGVEFPLVVGRDFLGEVVRAGPAARLSPGARIWGVVPPHRPGAHADYVVVKDAWAGLAPEALDDLQAGGALYAGLSACAVLNAAGLAGDGAKGARVLLLGVGGAGHAALQLLVARGAQVVVGCAGEVCAHATRLGATLALDRHAPDYRNQLVREGPYEAIVDCAGLGGAEAGAHPWKFKRFATLSSPLLRLTDKRGVLPGGLSALATLLRQGVAVTPYPAPSCSPPVRWAYFAPSVEHIEEIRRLAERGQFTVQVEHVYPWWEAADAYERASATRPGREQKGEGVGERAPGARGKLLIDFTADPPPDETLQTA